MTLTKDNQARINKLESLYGKIKARTEKTVVSDKEPENPTLGLQWFDTTELAFKIWGGREWEATTVKSLSVGSNPNWFRVDENGNMWSGRETLISAQNDTFAVLNTGKLYAKNAEISGNITITGGSGYIPPGGAASDINNNTTTISGGKITTGSITASQIATNTITTSQLNFTPVQPGTGDNAVNSSGKITSINGNLITVANINADNITSGTISADRIGANTITADKVQFGYAGSSAEGGAINTGFTSSNLNSVSAPSTGVKIDSTGIKMYSGGSEKVSIGADGNATFQGSITASTITGTTITGGTIRTSSSGSRIEINSELGILGIDSSGVYRTRLTTGGIIEFRTTGNSLTGTLEGVNISRPIVGGTSGSLYNSQGAIVSNGDLIAYGSGNILTNNDVYANRFYPGGKTSAYFSSAGSGARPFWQGTSESGSILYSIGVSASTATATRRIQVDIGGTTYYLLATL